MFVFWESVIKPMFGAVKPKTLVEVGADRGTHTRLLGDWAKTRGATLHVIDPAPLFGVDDFEREYGSHFVMHQALSVEALPAIGEPEAVLLDGDHNWYTVLEELRLVERAAERWPVTFLHDVDWPYGRRDMYYHPENVPAEVRQPYKFSGILPRISKLSAQGVNAEYANAAHEGGPHNGVLTAIEDFMDESRHALHLFFVRGPAGLALVIDDKRLKSKVGRIVQRVHDQGYALELTPRYASRFFD